MNQVKIDATLLSELYHGHWGATWTGTSQIDLNMTKWFVSHFTKELLYYFQNKSDKKLILLAFFHSLKFS